MTTTDEATEVANENFDAGYRMGIRDLDTVLMEMRGSVPLHIEIALLCATCVPPENRLDVTARVVLGKYGTIREVIDALGQSPEIQESRDDDGNLTGLYRLVWSRPCGRMLLHVYPQDLRGLGLDY
jgi:hypothetical protein